MIDLEQFKCPLLVDQRPISGFSNLIKLIVTWPLRSIESKQTGNVGLPELIYGTEKKRAKNLRKNIALTAKEIESSSSPNKISENHTSKMEAKNETKIKQEENLDADEEKLKQPIIIIKNDIRFEDLQTFSKNITWKYPSKRSLEILKYPVTRTPHHTNQFVRRQQYGGWNWRNGQSQHPDAITGSRYNVYSPQFLLPSYHHPSFSHQRPTLYPRNQRFPQRPTVLRPNAPTFNPVKEHKTIIRYSNIIKQENL
ncbi:hypothetical protein TNCV_108381 [Trichonephila clavipes]|nr:hypothetical protein TNCV_108381 [Trichonephila clavipes]